MAEHKRKKVEEESPKDEDDKEEEEENAGHDSDSSEGLELMYHGSAKEWKGEIVDVDFNFRDMRESDYHSIRQFLLNYLDGKEFDVSGLTNTIVEQVEVGTNICVEEDETLGFVTALPHGDDTCFQQLKDFVLSKAPNNLRDDLAAVMDTSLGWVISERILNLPAIIAPPLVQCLVDDIAWACQNAQDKSKFKFRKFLILARAQPPQSRNSTPSSGQRKKKRQKRAQPEADSSMSFVHIEESVMFDHAQFSFTFECSRAGIPMRRVCMVVDAEKMPQIASQIQSIVNENL